MFIIYVLFLSTLTEYFVHKPTFQSNCIYPLVLLECTYASMEGPVSKDDRGNPVGTHNDVSDIKSCGKLCDKNENCQSILFSRKNQKCNLKDVLLTGSEPIPKKNENMFSVYRTCKEGKFILRLKHSFTILFNKSCLS